MQQIIDTLEPLLMDELYAMRMFFPHKDDHFDIAVILKYMGSLVSGVADKIGTYTACSLVVAVGEEPSGRSTSHF